MNISKIQTYQYTPITITLETLEDYYDMYNMLEVYISNRKYLTATEIEKAMIFQKDLKKAHGR